MIDHEYIIGLVIVTFFVSIILVAFSALIGPFIFQVIGYNLTSPNSVTASEATNYTLQSFFVVVIGVGLAALKNE